MDATSHVSRQPLRLLVADDHLVVAQGVERLLLEHFDEVELVVSGEALVERVLAGQADLVVADISMEGITGIEAMRRVRGLGHATPFIFLTMHGDNEMAMEAMRAGASGYLLKSSAGEELVSAIRTVQAGGSYVTPTLAGKVITSVSGHDEGHSLTEKQQRVLSYVAQGLRSKQIAYELGISVRTVESHKYAIMQALDVHGTVKLVRRAEQLGLVPGFARERPAA